MSSSSTDPGAAPRRNEVLSRETDDGSFELILETGEMRSVEPEEAHSPEPLAEPGRRRKRLIYGGAAALALLLVAGISAVVLSDREGEVTEFNDDSPEVRGFKPYGGGAPNAPAPSGAAAVVAEPEAEVIEDEAAWALEEADALEVESPRVEPQVEVPAQQELAEEVVDEVPDEFEEEVIGEAAYAEEDEEPVDDGYEIQIQRPDLQRLRQRQGNVQGIQKITEPIFNGRAPDIRARQIAPRFRDNVDVEEEPLEDDEYYEEPLAPEDEVYDDELPEDGPLEDEPLEDEVYPDEEY